MSHKLSCAVNDPWPGACTCGNNEPPAVSDDARDAARYRWLRAQFWDTSPVAVVIEPKRSVKLGAVCPSLDHLDRYVDAAMAREKDK